MAKMLPLHFDAATASSAERRLFQLLESDVATSDWTVLHSLGLAKRGKKPYGEIDFVVLIPTGGVICLEVKGGRIACRDGEWETTNRFDERERMRRSPFLQAREGMFALRDSVLSRVGLGFPTNIVFGYAVAMPDVTFEERSPEWESWQIIDRDALRRPLSESLLRVAREQRKMHPRAPTNEPSVASLKAIRQLLRPDFEIVISRSAQIEETEEQLLRLTEEQFEGLDLLEGNERCLFEGAAGTGKTMLALEYARRQAAQGRRTLLLCFNRLLGQWLDRQIVRTSNSTLITAGSYFRLLRELIMRSSVANDFREQELRNDNFELYTTTYGVCGQLAAEELGDPYDVLVMDEAQDLLKRDVLNVLRVWLKGGMHGGQWAIFGDFQQQAIFGSETAEELRALVQEAAPQFAKGRLTLNCRNTRSIGEETGLLSGFESLPYRLSQAPGLPVDYHYYASPTTQRAALQTTLERHLSDGVKPADIVVLSPLRMENSGISVAQEGERFRLVEDEDGSPERSRLPRIRFATVQAFKGLESPVVVLCDIDKVSQGEPRSVLYVAMSRARSHLTVLVHESARAAIADCIRRKLQR